MYVDEAHGYLPEDRQGNRRIVDEGPRTAAGQKLAAQYAVAVDTLETEFGKHAGHARSVADAEYSLYHRLTRSLAHHAHVGALAQQQAESTEYYRLAGTGLAGDDVETGVELDLYIADKGIVGYEKTFNHFSAPFFSSSRRCCSVG